MTMPFQYRYLYRIEQWSLQQSPGLDARGRHGKRPTSLNSPSSKLFDIPPHGIKLSLSSTDQIPDLRDVGDIPVPLELSANVRQRLLTPIFGYPEQCAGYASI